MVVNQSDITDPATGTFGQSVPLDSIETVNVLQTPFLAQYGRFTQSVVAVETKRGGENGMRISTTPSRFPHPQLSHAWHPR